MHGTIPSPRNSYMFDLFASKDMPEEPAVYVLLCMDDERGLGMREL